MSTIFLSNKYTKWYYNIILTASLRTIYSGYTEKHHIIPKSFGGDNSISNIVKLTAREHFICHILLPKMTKGKNKAKMIYAARMMCLMENKNQHRYVNSHLYKSVKEQYKQMMIGHPYFGPFTQTKESNLKRSKALKGIKRSPRTIEHAKKLIYKRTEKHRKHLSNIRTGVSWGTHSEETKNQMSERQKGKSQPKTECEYCGIICSKMNYGRWHGNKCKQFNSDNYNLLKS